MGRSSSRRAPTGHRDLRSTACRSPLRCPPPPQPTGTAASTRRRDRRPLRGRPEPRALSSLRSRNVSMGRVTAASARFGAASRCSKPVQDRAAGGRLCSPARPNGAWCPWESIVPPLDRARSRRPARSQAPADSGPFWPAAAHPNRRWAGSGRSGRGLASILWLSSWPPEVAQLGGHLLAVRDEPTETPVEAREERDGVRRAR